MSTFVQGLSSGTNPQHMHPGKKSIDRSFGFPESCAQAYLRSMHYASGSQDVRALKENYEMNKAADAVKRMKPISPESARRCRQLEKGMEALCDDKENLERWDHIDEYAAQYLDKRNWKKDGGNCRFKASIL